VHSLLGVRTWRLYSEPHARQPAEYPYRCARHHQPAGYQLPSTNYLHCVVRQLSIPSARVGVLSLVSIRRPAEPFHHCRWRPAGFQAELRSAKIVGLGAGHVQGLARAVLAGPAATQTSLTGHRRDGA
jgi:hypothetical protein